MWRFLKGISINVLIWLSFFQVSVCSYSQVQKTIFQHLTTNNGLSQNYIDCIFRDVRGFMWFGTWEGLNYYNGYNFIVYRNDSSQNSISNNFIHSICDDRNGDLWIGTQNGLNKFVFSENRFVRYFHNETNANSISDNAINHVFRDSKNNIWISTSSNGMDKLTFENGKQKFKHYQYDPYNPNGLSSNEVNCAIEDHEGNIWIGTVNGLNRLNPQTGENVIYKNDPADINSLTNSTITCIAEGLGHDLWVGTKFGLTKFDTKNKSYTRFWATQNDPEGLTSIAIKSIIKDLTGNILIATLDGLYKYNPGRNGFLKFEQNATNELSLNNNFINSLLCDIDGNVWVGTEKGGVNKYCIYSQKFFNFTHKSGNDNYLNQSIVNSVYEDSLYVWVGTAGGGLNEFNKKTRKFRFHEFRQTDLKTISSNYITGITRDSRGTLWITTWGGGINRFVDFNRGTFRYFSYVSVNTDSLNWNLISSMLEFPKGNMWIGSFLGISHMDLKSEKISVLNTQKTLGIPIKAVGCLMKDSKNNLWVGTENGLFRLKWNNLQAPNLDKPDSVFKYTNDPMNKKSIAGNFIISMCEDKLGNLWFSSYGLGLEKLEPNGLKGKEAQFKHYDKTNGLPNAVIYGILEDHEGNLWLGTENGLSKFNPQKNSYQNFFESDGIQGNQFYWGAYFKSPSGKMYFGGTNGLTTFWPDSITGNKLIKRVIFTDFKIFNKSVSVDPNNKNALPKHINSLENVNLRYSQNMFSVEFAGLNYDIYNFAKYAYKLEGFDADWIYVDAGRRYATYTNLSPGQYVLKVKAANRDGVWNNDYAELKINILPEWWQTILFRVVLFVFVALLLLFVYFNRVRVFRSRQKQLQLMVAQRTEMLNKQTNEILAQKDEIIAQKDEIGYQNQELQRYGNHLEEMVKERTIDLELARNKAVEADKLKSSFLSNLSHEIRTPLNAIVGFSSLIAHSESASDPVYDWVNAVESSNEMLLRLIDDIIDFAKIETGQLNIHNKNYTLYKVVKDIYDSFLMKLEKKLLASGNATLLLSVDEECKSLVSYSDADRVSQILSNLINNAIKFTTDGFVEIGYKKYDEDTILVWVKDSGIGIDPKNHQIIFDRFRKIEDETKILYRGTGLGLAIVKHLLELMDGKIWLESELCQGATFYFTLRQNSEAFLPTIPDKKEDRLAFKGNLAGYRILVAEDEDANYKYIETILLKEKVTVIRALNGEEAVEFCNETHQINMILMDIKMPVMNGIDATVRIKKNYPDIPIFAVTAYALADERENILKAEFDEYLTKPVAGKYLISLINKYVNG